jgi:hypothetical protein
MHVRTLDPAGHLRPQKLAPRDVPHVVIEPNSTCDLACRRCYAAGAPVVKPLSQVVAEIDLACRARRLDSVSLLGGEPTLHPDLEAMVREIKARGLVCMVLTHGAAFLRAGGEDRLDALIAAGVDRFVLHVDDGQGREAAATRHALARLMEARRTWFGLAVTLSAGEETALPALLREMAAYRFFDGVLVTLAMDPPGALRPGPPAPGAPDIGLVHAALRADLAVEPVAFIPSNLDDAEVCWLVYFHYLDPTSGRAFAPSPLYNRLFRRLYRALAGREFFAATLSERWALPTLVLTLVAEVLLHPGRLPALWRFLRAAPRLRDLRFQYAVIQQGPRWNDAHGQPQICWQCPDATVRDGRLVPVCLAQQLAPMDGSPSPAPAEARQRILDHLGAA